MDIVDTVCVLGGVMRRYPVPLQSMFGSRTVLATESWTKTPTAQFEVREYSWLKWPGTIPPYLVFTVNVTRQLILFTSVAPWLNDIHWEDNPRIPGEISWFLVNTLLHICVTVPKKYTLYDEVCMFPTDVTGRQCTQVKRARTQKKKRVYPEDWEIFASDYEGRMVQCSHRHHDIMHGDRRTSIPVDQVDREQLFIHDVIICQTCARRREAFNGGVMADLVKLISALERCVRRGTRLAQMSGFAAFLRVLQQLRLTTRQEVMCHRYAFPGLVWDNVSTGLMDGSVDAMQLCEGYAIDMSHAIHIEELGLAAYIRTQPQLNLLAFVHSILAIRLFGAVTLKTLTIDPGTLRLLRPPITSVVANIPIWSALTSPSCQFAALRVALAQLPHSVHVFSVFAPKIQAQLLLHADLPVSQYTLVYYQESPLESTKRLRNVLHTEFTSTTLTEAVVIWDSHLYSDAELLCVLEICIRDQSPHVILAGIRHRLRVDYTLGLFTHLEGTVHELTKPFWLALTLNKPAYFIPIELFARCKGDVVVHCPCVVQDGKKVVSSYVVANAVPHANVRFVFNDVLMPAGYTQMSDGYIAALRDRRLWYINVATAGIFAEAHII